MYVVDEEANLSRSPILIAEALKCYFSRNDLTAVVEKREIPDELRVRLVAFLEQAVKAVKATPKAPLLKSFSGRDQIELPRLVARARDRVHLITTNLSYWADTRVSCTIENVLLTSPSGEESQSKS